MERLDACTALPLRPLPPRRFLRPLLTTIAVLVLLLLFLLLPSLCPSPRLILLPLRESRREKFDYLENTLKLIKHFKKVQPKEKNKVLSNYVNKRTGYLDMEKHKAVLIKILRNEPFFKRFDI